jgi:ankyrin repeat protein
MMGRLEFLRLLCAQRGKSWSVNAQNSDGETLLHRATRYGNVDVVAFVLHELHADADIPNRVCDLPAPCTTVSLA